MTMVKNSRHLLPLSGVRLDGSTAGMLVEEEPAWCEQASNYSNADSRKPRIVVPQRTRVVTRKTVGPTAKLQLRKRTRKMMSWMRWTASYLGLVVMTTIRAIAKGRKW